MRQRSKINPIGHIKDVQHLPPIPNYFFDINSEIASFCTKRNAERFTNFT